MIHPFINHLNHLSFGEFMRGKFIVIEGSDGSGKTTQADLLGQRLSSDGKQIFRLDFPDYQSEPGKRIAAYLRGESGSLEGSDPRAIAKLYAEDRLLKKKLLLDALAAGKIVISNRYVESNLAYQGAKVRDRNEQSVFIDWLRKLEYGEHGLPKPDLIIFLYVPLAFSQQLLLGKGYRDYVHGNKKDLHESNLPYLESVERIYLDLANVKPWVKIDCVSNGKMMMKEDIAKQVFTVFDSCR